MEINEKQFPEAVHIAHNRWAVAVNCNSMPETLRRRREDFDNICGIHGLDPVRVMEILNKDNFEGI